MVCDLCGRRTFTIYIIRKYGSICFVCYRMVTTMFIPDGFELYELLPKAFYQSYYSPDNAMKLWNIFDYRLKYTIHHLRKLYGTMVMNDWIWGGVNQYRGWRPTDCICGARFSQHKYGRAGDLKPTKVSVHKVREDILSNPFSIEFKYITCVEMDVTWLHVDVRDHDKKKHGILKVYP